MLYSLSPVTQSSVHGTDIEPYTLKTPNEFCSVHVRSRSFTHNAKVPACL